MERGKDENYGLLTCSKSQNYFFTNNWNGLGMHGAWCCVQFYLIVQNLTLWIDPSSLSGWPGGVGPLCISDNVVDRCWAWWGTTPSSTPSCCGWGCSGSGRFLGAASPSSAWVRNVRVGDVQVVQSGGCVEAGLGLKKNGIRWIRDETKLFELSCLDWKMKSLKSLF